MTWRDAGTTPVLGRLFSERLEKLLGPARRADAPLEQRHRDLAASMQARLEEVLLEHVAELAARTKQKALCLAGGVAFNCVANGKMLERTPFERIYVQPAAGDAGLSVGAAFAVEHTILGRPRAFVMEHAGWGPGFSRVQIKRALDERVASGDGVEIQELNEDALVDAAARELADGKILGWFQGRAEWGAAGSRQSQHSGRSAAC